MARRMTPQQIVDKQIARAQAAAPDYVAGVSAVTEAPNTKAAAKKDKYAANVAAAVANGTYEQANLAVGLAGWQGPAKEKGGARYAPGVAAAKPKLLAFQTAYQPVRQAVAAKVNAMPDDTFEQRLAKADANARGLHAQPYKKRRM